MQPGHTAPKQLRLFAAIAVSTVCPTVTTPSTVVTQPTGDCKDVSDTCDLLNFDFYCNSTEYASWAYANCRKTCQMCNIVTTPTTVATQPAGDCKDVMDTCDILDFDVYCNTTEYASWAYANCRKTCQMCNIGSMPCQDCNHHATNKTEYCTYKGQNYHNGAYWTDGCQYNCTCADASIGYYRCRSLCPSYTNLPRGCALVKLPNKCCAEPNCSIDIQPIPFRFNCGSHQCHFNDTCYSQGESWDDGCVRSCTCTDASTDYYSCRDTCLNWNSLPSVCHMEDAPAGLCCKQLRCPSTIVIQIPSAYKGQYPGYTYV